MRTRAGGTIVAASAGSAAHIAPDTLLDASSPTIAPDVTSAITAPRVVEAVTSVRCPCGSSRRRAPDGPDLADAAMLQADED